jgi:hypothetical protein
MYKLSELRRHQRAPVDVTQSEVVTSCVRVPQCAAIATTTEKGYIVCSATSPKPRPSAISARKSAACSSRHGPHESAGNEHNNAGIVISVSIYPTDRDISASAAPSPRWPQHPWGWQGPSRNSLHRAAHAAASCSDGSTGALCNS